MTDSILHYGTEVYLSYEDWRYPTLVVRPFTLGHSVFYALDLKTGVLRRVCGCAAHSESECVCGAWEDDK